jgi:transcriptional regulator with XRE-family HTH domain
MLAQLEDKPRTPATGGFPATRGCDWSLCSLGTGSSFIALPLESSFTTFCTSLVPLTPDRVGSITLTMAGSGGEWSVQSFQVNYPTGLGAVQVWRDQTAQVQGIGHNPLASQVGFIRHFLSLSVSDLAQLLEVERPTVYGWLTGKSLPRKQNLDRLARLYEVAKLWRSQHPTPLRQAKWPVLGGQSLYDLLRGTDFDPRRLQSVLSGLSSSQTMTATKRKKPDSISSIATRHGLRPVSERQQRRSIRRETRDS